MDDVLQLLRSLLPADPLEFRIALFMLCGSIVAALGAWQVCRSNARLQQRIEHRRAKRRGEAQAREQAVDALSGRAGAHRSDFGNSDKH